MDDLRYRVQGAESEIWAQQATDFAEFAAQTGVVVARSALGWVIECPDGSQVVNPLNHSSGPLAIGQRVDLVLRDGIASVDYRPTALTRTAQPAAASIIQPSIPCGDIADRVYAELIRRGHRTLAANPSGLTDLRTIICELHRRKLWQALDYFYCLNQSSETQAWKLNLATLNPIDDLAIVPVPNAFSLIAGLSVPDGRTIPYLYGDGTESDVLIPGNNSGFTTNVPDYTNCSLRVVIPTPLTRYRGSSTRYCRILYTLTHSLTPEGFSTLTGASVYYRPGQVVERYRWGARLREKVWRVQRNISTNRYQSYVDTVTLSPEGEPGSVIELEGLSAPGESSCACNFFYAGGVLPGALTYQPVPPELSQDNALYEGCRQIAVLLKDY